MIKYIFKIAVSVMFMLSLQGCYTILWSPDMEFPNRENSDHYTYDNYYYGYYYYDFYNTPWWFGISAPVREYLQRTEGSLRSNDGGRNPSSNRILEPGTPSRTPQGGSGNTTNNPPPTSRTESDTNKNSDLRNNDGGRNTDKGRK